MPWSEKEEYSTKLLASGDDLDCKGCEIQLIRFQKGKYSHYHKKKTEFFYFIKGEGTIIIDGKEKNLSKGSIVILKPNQRHTFVNTLEAPLEAIMVKTNSNSGDTFTD